MNKTIRILFISAIIIVILIVVVINISIKSYEKESIAPAPAPSLQINTGKSPTEKAIAPETQKEEPERESPLPSNEPLAG